VPIRDGELWLAADFLSPSDSQLTLQRLLAELAWRQDSIALFGRPLAIPRLQAWYGDAGCSYRYSGVTLQPHPWSPTLLALKTRIETLLQEPFNAVLANLYRDGNDSVGWHADNEPELGENPLIASLSLGAERRFCLRHRRHKTRTQTLRLPAGSLLVMAGTLQHHWLHALPKSRVIDQPRINLSFRSIVHPHNA